MRLWLQVVLIIGTFVAVAVGLWFRRGADVTAAVTTAYVILVFLQLEVMRKQYRLLESERREILDQERRRVPRLEQSEPRISRTKETDSFRKVELGPALYINCFVTNVGGSVAKLAEPVLTAVARRSADNRWQRTPDWLPLGLRWSLDEINLVRGSPTEGRLLVPNRPYLFDLAKISAYLPQPRLEMLTLLKPAAQETDYSPGEYCFEVTIYSENAAPASAWYLVSVDRDVSAPDPLKVSRLPAAPWDTATR
jgi:hypothetical protein